MKLCEFVQKYKKGTVFLDETDHTINFNVTLNIWIVSVYIELAMLVTYA